MGYTSTMGHGPIKLNTKRKNAEKNRSFKILSTDCCVTLELFWRTWDTRGASKIKLKNVNKKRMATARRQIFCNFSRHPLLIWLHCCFHYYKTLKAVARATAAIVVLTPANFYHFRRPKFNFSLSPSLLRPMAKNLQKHKSLLGSVWRKSKQKIEKKAFKSPAMKWQQFVTKIFQ